MGIFDRISRIMRAEMNSRSSQPHQSLNSQARELEQQATSLRQQIANLEARDQHSMDVATRQEYATSIANLKRSLATLEQAILEFGGTVAPSIDAEEVPSVSSSKSQAPPKLKNKHSTDDIDAELEAIRRDLDEL